jgi:hypothetical protein
VVAHGNRGVRLSVGVVEVLTNHRVLQQPLGGGGAAEESLLAERIASLWALTELQEALLSAYYGGLSKNLSPAYLLQMVKLQESTNRRYLSAIRTLAQVRKLQGDTPTLNLTQINVS